MLCLTFIEIYVNSYVSTNFKFLIKFYKHFIQPCLIQRSLHMILMEIHPIIFHYLGKFNCQGQKYPDKHGSICLRIFLVHSLSAEAIYGLLYQRSFYLPIILKVSFCDQLSPVTMSIR